HRARQHQVRDAATECGSGRVGMTNKNVDSLLVRYDGIFELPGQDCKPGSMSAAALRPALDFGEQPAHLPLQILCHRSLIEPGFAAQQVVGLNGRRTFVNTQNPGIPKILGSPGLLDIAHASVYLYAQGGNFDGVLGTKTLDYRNKVLVQGLLSSTFVIVGMVT